MNTDEQLRHLLTSAAESYEPPADGATRLLDQGRRTYPPKPRRHFPSSRTLRVAGAAVAAGVLAVAIGMGVASTGRPSRNAPAGATRASGAPSGATAAPSLAPLRQAQLGAGTGSATSPQNAPPNPAPLPARSARVVQTGQVALQVQDGQVQPALDRLGAIATGAGGYLSDTRDSEGDGTPSGTSTLRVPVARFSSVLSQVRKVGKVVSSSSSARDVTGDYVDLSARINALQQTRATYLTLLSRAASIGDTLAVQQQVQQVQTQIEQLQGQQKVLADESDLATLAVSVSEAGAVVPPPVHKSASGFSHALHRAIHGFNSGLQVIITVAGPVLLVLLVLGLFGMLGRRGYRLVRRWQA